MTLKIVKKPPKRKAKQTAMGWHSLGTNELILWAYMWLERKDNARFSEPVRQWALRLHTTPSSLTRWIRALLSANVVLAGKGDRDQDGWKIAAAYIVTEPPADVITYAQAWWKVEDSRSRSVPLSVHDEPCVNSGDAGVPKMEHLTTNNEQHQCSPVSMSVVKKEPLSTDSVGVPKTVHGEPRTNGSDDRVPKMDHGLLKAPQTTLKEEMEELTFWEKVGKSGNIEKSRQRVADLKAKIIAMQERSVSDYNRIATSEVKSEPSGSERRVNVA